MDRSEKMVDIQQYEHTGCIRSSQSSMCSVASFVKHVLSSVAAHTHTHTHTHTHMYET
jgi:hypothetical protein